MEQQLIVTTTDSVPGREVATLLGIARGSTVRSRHVGRDITAVFKTIVGGEVEEYTSLQADAREQALQRMREDAARLSAHAVVTVRFETAMVANGAAELLAYGTAVELR